MKKLTAILLTLVILLFPLASCEKKNGTTDIHFLMINDTHGEFVSTDGAPGVERLATLVKELEKENGQVIKIANGDIFQGSYISSTLHGRPMVEALNEMDFDCFVLGNHEFDWGLAEIAKYADGDDSNGEAEFPFLCANIIEKSTGKAPEWLKPYVVIEYENEKVGVIGTIGENLESDILTSNVKDYEFVESTEIVKTHAKTLRELGCTSVVLATHDCTNFTNNMIARFYGDEQIDAIFCGHTHVKTNKPIMTGNRTVPVVQNGDKSETVTALTLSYKDSVCSSYEVTQYDPMQYATDPAMTEHVVKNYTDMITSSGKVIANANSTLSKSTLGTLACDAVMIKNDAVAGLVNSGGIRAEIAAGEITVADVFGVFPFENAVVLVEMTGGQLTALMGGTGSLHCSMAEIVPLPEEKYTVATIDYVYESAEYASLFDGCAVQYTGIVMRDIIIEYIASQKTLG